MTLPVRVDGQAGCERGTAWGTRTVAACRDPGGGSGTPRSSAARSGGGEGPHSHRAGARQQVETGADPSWSDRDSPWSFPLRSHAEGTHVPRNSLGYGAFPSSRCAGWWQWPRFPDPSGHEGHPGPTRPSGHSVSRTPRAPCGGQHFVPMGFVGGGCPLQAHGGAVSTLWQAWLCCVDGRLGVRRVLTLRLFGLGMGLLGRTPCVCCCSLGGRSTGDFIRRAARGGRTAEAPHFLSSLTPGFRASCPAPASPSAGPLWPV